MDGEQQGGVWRDTDKNSVPHGHPCQMTMCQSHPQRQDGPQTHPRCGSDDKTDHHTRAHTHTSRGYGNVYCLHNEAFCGEQGGSSNRSRNGLGESGGLGFRDS